MIVSIFVFGGVVVGLLMRRAAVANQFKKTVQLLLSQSANVAGKTYTTAQLARLPEPVQRYFKLVLKDGQPYISNMRATHNGQFKTGKGKAWVNIVGEQYATTDTPGFIWKGVTSLFTACDMYVAGKGRLIVSLLSAITIMDGKGQQYDQGELIRWLGESVLYPTNFLPNDRQQWQAINEVSARLDFRYTSLSLFLIATFNDVGEMVQLETKRYMDEENEETWIIKLSNYQVMNDVMVPMNFEVLWRLPEGDFSYAKFNVKTIAYNQ